MGRKKNPQAVDNWANTSSNAYKKAYAEKGLRKVKAQRVGKKFKLIPNPNGSGMIEVEVTN